MTKKLERMMQEYDQALAGKEALAEEVAKLKDAKELQEAQAEAAALQGDIPLYRKIRDEAKETADTLFVREKQLEKLTIRKTEKEARDAWEEYAEDYNKKFVKAWASYEAARSNLYAAFMALVKDQAEAFEIREKCAAIAGIDLGLRPGNALDSRFPLKTIPDKKAGTWMQPQLNTPDTNFYLQLLDNVDLDYFNNVVRLHVSGHTATAEA